jgi:hypothetical protein
MNMFIVIKEVYDNQSTSVFLIRRHIRNDERDVYLVPFCCDVDKESDLV